MYEIGRSSSETFSESLKYKKITSGPQMRKNHDPFIETIVTFAYSAPENCSCTQI